MSGATVCRYQSSHGARTVLVLDRDGAGARVVMIGVPVSMRCLPAQELCWLSPLDDYPPRQVARRMLAAGRVLGITSKARRALRRALGQVHGGQ